jgi:hypothetical protein
VPPHERDVVYERDSHSAGVPRFACICHDTGDAGDGPRTDEHHRHSSQARPLKRNARISSECMSFADSWTLLDRLPAGLHRSSVMRSSPMPSTCASRSTRPISDHWFPFIRCIALCRRLVFFGMQRAWKCLCKPRSSGFRKASAILLRRGGIRYRQKCLSVRSLYADRSGANQLTEPLQVGLVNLGDLESRSCSRFRPVGSRPST